MAVAFDDKSDGGTHHWDGGADSHSHTLGSISDGVVLVCFTVDWQADDAMPADEDFHCTVDGNTANLISGTSQDIDGLMKSIMFESVTGSTSGSITIAYNVDGTTLDISVKALVMSFSGADQTTPVENGTGSTDGNSDKDTTVTVTSATNDMTADFLGSRVVVAQVIVSGTPTQRINGTGNSSGWASSTAPGASTVVHAWTNPGGRTAQSACSIKAVAAAPSVDFPVSRLAELPQASFGPPTGAVPY